MTTTTLNPTEYTTFPQLFLELGLKYLRYELGENTGYRLLDLKLQGSTSIPDNIADDYEDIIEGNIYELHSEFVEEPVGNITWVEVIIQHRGNHLEVSTQGRKEVTWENTQELV